MNRDITYNAAIFVIAAVFLYVAIVCIIAASKKHITIYQVSKSDVNNNIIVDALAIRDEVVVTSTKSGYACYFIRDGEKVKKNATVCTIDSTGRVYTTLENNTNFDELLTKQNYQDIRALISLYKTSYSDAAFYNAYGFETNINNKVLELTGEMMTKQADDSGVALTSVSAPESGLVTYYTDGYENYDPSKISARDFDRSKYTKTTLKSGEATAAGSPVAKILPNEVWHIYAPLSRDQIGMLDNEDHYVLFHLDNEKYNIYMPFTVIEGSDGTYIDITVDKFMYNFVSERFVRLEILLESDIGLKVPKSAIVDKEIYKIPLNYFISAENGSYSDHLEIQYVKKDGSKATKSLVPTVYREDEKYAYCDPNNFELTDVIINRESGQEIAVSLMETSKLPGVYSANRGTAEFRTVTVIKEVDEFTLIKASEMISPFDNIVLDSTQVKENQVLY